MKNKYNILVYTAPTQYTKFAYLYANMDEAKDKAKWHSLKLSVSHVWVEDVDYSVKERYCYCHGRLTRIFIKGEMMHNFDYGRSSIKIGS